MRQVRRLDLIWQDKEVGKYEAEVMQNNQDRPCLNFVKELIEKAIERKNA